MICRSRSGSPDIGPTRAARFTDEAIADGRTRALRRRFHRVRREVDVPGFDRAAMDRYAASRKVRRVGRLMTAEIEWADE